MKKIIFTFCLLMAAMFLTAQDVPQAINFQAIARDANSEVMANTPIMIQLSIIDGSPEGELIYREIRSLTTNAYGSFSFQIGRDPYMAVGEFADIDWAGGRKFLKIDYDPTAMLQFNLSLGIVEFVSVPYAFAAGSVSYIDATGANDGDVLAYNATTGRFEPVAMSGAGGGITVETDPTVPDWAKAETKPTYDYSEIENTPDLSGYLTTESQTLADVAALGNSVNTQLKNVTDPTDAQDAVTKSYVDNLIAQLQEAINNIGGGSPTLPVPSVTTSDASNITSSGATLSGEVTSDGGEVVLSRGFMYGTSADDLSQNVQSGSGIGSFTADLAGLTSGTTYYYKAYATNSEGTSYGEVMSFTTIGSMNYSEGTFEWVRQGPTTATGLDEFGLEWTANFAKSIYARIRPLDGARLYILSSSDYAITDVNTLNMRLTSETEATEYRNVNHIDTDSYQYDEVIATVYNGKTYLIHITRSITTFDQNTGNRVTITGTYKMWESAIPASVPTVITSTATNIIDTGATLTGNVASNGGASVTARGFMYGTSASNLSQTVQSGSGIGSFTADLAGLTSGTIYYYKAYATNSEGTSYGDVRTFTTVVVYLPTVTTDTASNVNATGATLSGNVTSDGNATVTARGFVYGTSANNLSQTVRSGSGTGSFTIELTGLSSSSNTTYYYKAYATNAAGTAYGDVMTFTITASTGTVNGHAWVDLGLPSGTRWATCNVGASTPTAYGNYYAWGETTTKSSYTSDNYTYSDNPTTLPSNRDAATANWGSGWRMPTYDELNELKNNCTVTWTTQSGVYGLLFTGPNGNSIFLPAAGRYDSYLYNVGCGFYWSSSLGTDYPYGAWSLSFSSLGYDMYGDDYRGYGFTVRAVYQSQN